MSLILTIASGALIGAVAGAIVWSVFPVEPVSEPSDSESLLESRAIADATSGPEEKEADPAALLLRRGTTVPVVFSPLLPSSDSRPNDPEDLNFYFSSFVSAAAPDNIQYANVTLTNRSERAMHLEFWGHWDYWKDNGEPMFHGCKAEWNPDGLKPRTGKSYVDLSPGETQIGRLIIFLDTPTDNGVEQWFLDSSDGVFIEVFESVSGKRAAFVAAKGYPDGQVSSPVPTFRERIASEQPELQGRTKTSSNAAKSSDLVLRLRNFGYTSTSFNADAMLANKSSNSISIEMRLLLRQSRESDVWGAALGRFSEQGDEAADSHESVAVARGETAIMSLSFDLSKFGVANKEGWRLNQSIESTLLEIRDLETGDKTYCSPFIGYPPGIDFDVTPTD